MQKNKTVVTVRGKEYTLVGTEPVEYMQRVAAYVDRRMTEISYSSYQPDDRLMTLTAINIADELLKSKDEVNAMRKELSQMRQALHRAQQLRMPLDENKPE